MLVKLVEAHSLQQLIIHCTKINAPCSSNVLFAHLCFHFVCLKLVADLRCQLKPSKFLACVQSKWDKNDVCCCLFLLSQFHRLWQENKQTFADQNCVLIHCCNLNAKQFPLTWFNPNFWCMQLLQPRQAEQAVIQSF